jgi:protein disulfide isomerase
MRVSSLILAFGLLFALVAQIQASDEKDVIVLTDKTFDEKVNDADIMLVEFYAPWCGHCKKLAPEYAVAATTLLKNDPPIKLAKVDCTVETALASRFGIKGYPTLKVFRKGTPTDYSGPRDSKGIIAYMEKQAGPSAKPISSADQLKKLTSASDVVVVGFFPSKSGNAYNNFLKTADSLRDHFKFAEVNDQAILDEYKAQEGIVMLKQFDDKEVVYGGSNTVGALTDWIWERSVPVAGEWNADTVERYKKKNLPVLKVYIDVDQKGSNAKRTNYYLNRLRKVAEEKEFDGKLAFAIADKKKYNDELQKFNLDASKEVNVAIDNFPGNTKYKFEGGEFSVQNLKEFAQQYLEGKLKPYIKSEPVPTEQGDVKVVVGQTFNDIVLDNTKDVLIEMYAPWCGHCKKLEPTYNELAGKLKNVENVVIAKMDATANDSPHPKYQAKGYPTILFAPAGSKDAPIPYQGERTIDAFTSFLKSKASSWKTSDGKDEL